jgi:hypothetical protein
MCLREKSFMDDGLAFCGSCDESAEDIGAFNG